MVALAVRNQNKNCCISLVFFILREIKWYGFMVMLSISKSQVAQLVPLPSTLMLLLI